MGVFTDLIESTDGETRFVLQEVLDRALDLVPEAIEDLSYGTPALRYRGSPARRREGECQPPLAVPVQP